MLFLSLNGIYILFIGIWFRWIHIFFWMNERTNQWTGIGMGTAARQVKSSHLKFNWIWCQFNFMFSLILVLGFFVWLRTENLSILFEQRSKSKDKKHEMNWIDININNNRKNGMTSACVRVMFSFAMLCSIAIEFHYDAYSSYDWLTDCALCLFLPSVWATERRLRIYFFPVSFFFPLPIQFT